MARRLGKGLLVFLLILILLYGGLALLARPAPARPVLAAPDFLVMAHQGGDKLWPGNTLYAFQQATEMGVDVLEMDMRRASDGVLVIIHDETLERITDGRGRVADHSLAELKQLDAAYNWPYDDQSYPYRGQGHTIPTLAEVFTTLPSIRLNIDMKQWEADLPAQFCREIRQHGAGERVIAASFDAETIQRFRRECPEVATALGEAEVRVFFGLSSAFLGAIYTPVGEALQVPEYGGGFHLVTRRFVQTARQRNMKVHVWTVDEVADMQRLIDLGVDGIFTDRPDRLLSLLGRD